MQSDKRPFTEAERMRAEELRAAGASYMQIANALGRARSVVYSALTGKTYPHRNTGGKPTPKNTEGTAYRRCCKCRRQIPVLDGMSFCPYCGADIRSDYELTAKDLLDMLGDITHFYPRERRDFAVHTINKAVKLLRRADKNTTTGDVNEG